MTASVGEQLLHLCQNARRELLIIAPFIKYDALMRLLSNTAIDVRITCVTRWRPEELASGVSDIKVWDAIRLRDNASLWLRGNLHAKYYRADKQCLVGSANITSAALGWSPYHNLELLILLDANVDYLVEFEEYLFSGCTQVTDDIYQVTYSAVEAIKDAAYRPHIPIESDTLEAMTLTPEYVVSHFDTWLPTTRNPETVYIAYQGILERLSFAARDTAQLDLNILNVPGNLDLELFRRWVGVQLLQMPLVAKVDDFIKTARRFGEVRKYLAQIAYTTKSTEFDSVRAWQTLMRWLLYFLPERYEVIVPRHSEVIRRKI